jgi:hypothetical protein
MHPGFMHPGATGVGGDGPDSIAVDEFNGDGRPDPAFRR